MTDLPPELEPLVLAVLEARVKEARTVVRAAIEHRYAEGDKRTIRSPLDGTKLGTVYREDPDPRWEIVSPDALARWLAEDPDNVEYVDDIAGTTEQVIAVLAEHAPELLARIERVKASAFTAAKATAASGTPVPGVARVKPRGGLRVRPDKATAGPAIERLVQAGYLSWDGRLLQLPAGTSDEPSQPVTDTQEDTEAAS